MKPILPEGVRFIIEKLEENGKKGHIVGGCVRDFLLSKIPNDYDITTDATPNEMKKIFAAERTVETGIKHGTLTLLYKGEPYEVTTYRVDGEYEDHRRPKSVSFTDTLSGDLARRDFTMNAICYNERDGFVDMFSGIKDIKAGIIRAVGDAERRFEEDALRILRAVRFASVLGFTVDAETARSAKEKSHLLSAVSAERIYTEWKKLLSGKAAYEVISEYREILSRFLFKEKIILPEREKFAEAEAEERQLAIFYLSVENAAERFSDFCDIMKTDSKTKKNGAIALSNISIDLNTPKEVRLAAVRLGRESVALILKVKALCSMSCVSQSELDSILSEGYPLSLGELSVNGEDMRSLGFEGREIGIALERLLIVSASGEVKNERRELLALGKEMRNGV